VPSSLVCFGSDIILLIVVMSSPNAKNHSLRMFQSFHRSSSSMPSSSDLFGTTGGGEVWNDANDDIRSTVQNEDWYRVGASSLCVSLPLVNAVLQVGGGRDRSPIRSHHGGWVTRSDFAAVGQPFSIFPPFFFVIFETVDFCAF